MVPNLPHDWAKVQIARSIITPAVFLLGLVLAQVNIRIALFTPALIPVFRYASGRYILEPQRQQVPGEGQQGRKNGPSEIFWQLIVYVPLYAFALWFIWTSNFYQPH